MDNHYEYLLLAFEEAEKAKKKGLTQLGQSLLILTEPLLAGVEIEFFPAMIQLHMQK